MPRAAGVLETRLRGHRGQRRRRDPGPARVDRLDVGRKEDVRSGPRGRLPVRLEPARVAFDVLALGELRRVDEDAHHDRPPEGPGPSDESEVAGVEGAHGRNERTALDPGAVVDAVDRLHGRRRDVGARRPCYPANCRMISVSFWPPKPNELLRHVSIRVDRDRLGT